MVNFAGCMKCGEKYEEKAQVVLSEVFGTKLSEAGDRECVEQWAGNGGGRRE